MQFRIADTFTESLAKLNGAEQRAAKTTAFDLQLNPAQPGLQFHRVDRARDNNFWSVRVNKGVRMIVHKTAANFLLCYVGEHDNAYRWAERRRLEQHPDTGAAQLVEIREVVREIEIPRYVAAGSAVFAGVPDSQLLNYGVPAVWLDDVKQVADEDALLALADHLPAEAAEALLELATGNSPERPLRGATDGDPFAHPDAQRRFRVMSNQEELRRALEYPWEKWTVFLHPAQRQVVERTYRGPARVSGSAGTGKTIVALHRAVHLARHPLGHTRAADHVLDGRPYPIAPPPTAYCPCPLLHNLVTPSPVGPLRSTVETRDRSVGTRNGICGNGGYARFP